MNNAAPVRITEVGPRDGLQNEAGTIPTEAKVAFIRALVAAGCTDVEITSFVRPDVIPQLADAEALCAALGPAPEGVVYSALVPNARGLARALDAGVGKVAVFTGASETFTRKNINHGIEESLTTFGPLVAEARQAGRAVRGYLSCAWRCPYEGAIAAGRVVELVARLVDLGCDEVSVGDTIGAATPGEVGRLLDAILGVVPGDRVVLHFHDTRGMAVANVVEGLRHGILRYDASAAGLGGCPFAPGASGNLATEDLVFLLDGLGRRHGLDLERLRAAARTVAPHLDHALVGRVWQAPPLP